MGLAYDSASRGQFTNNQSCYPSQAECGRIAV